MTNTRWHVGHNDYGYSPSNEPACVDTPDEARMVLASNLAQLVDYLGDGCDHARHVTSCENCALYAKAFEVANHVSADDFDMGDGVRLELSDGRILPSFYWARPMDDGCECEPLTD